MTISVKLISLIIVPVIAYFVWRHVPSICSNQQQAVKRCWKDITNNSALSCQLQCEHGYFNLPGMNTCHPWLKCDDMSNVEIVKEVGQGAVKLVYLARWSNQLVVFNELRTQALSEDFQHGLQMLISYQPHPHVIQLIGYCHHRHSGTVITQYQPLGAALNLEAILTSAKYQKHNTLKTRFQMCLDYVSIINHLHNSSLGSHIMCDSNTLEKTLQQYLLTTDLRLVVNDLDALPVVYRTKNISAVCGHRELFGDFVAPEQLWPYEDREYEDTLMPGYDEKTDIWKIPELCDYFLGEYPQSQIIKFHLFKIHKQCKMISPGLRPSAYEVYEEYKTVWQTLDLENSLDLLS